MHSSSPGWITPAAIVPAKPRNSESGRLTDCTGRRNGCRCGPFFIERNRFQISNQCRAVVPLRSFAWTHDVVAQQRGNRNRLDLLDSKNLREGSVLCFDRAERALGPVDEIHLVYGKDDPAEPDEREHEGVPARLRDDALAGVDENNGGVCRACAGHHVARVLLVPGSVGDDELPPCGCKEPIRDINGDLLFSLGNQAVEKKREVKVAVSGTKPCRVALKHGQLVVKDVCDS